MKLIVDMNIPPSFCQKLQQAGIEAVHWSYVGNPSATDEEIFSYAQEKRYAILTYDLDFAIILAHTRSKAPSVIQIRTNDILTEEITSSVITTIQKHENEIKEGAIVTIDINKSRIRILPIQ